MFPQSSAREGVGLVYAKHGEIVQGLFYSSDESLEHGRVVVPCNLFFSRVRFRPFPSGPLAVEPADRRLSLTAARLAMDALGRTGWGGSIRIESNVPKSWGCGSSTADVVGTIYAVADALHANLEPQIIARLSISTESSSDPLMYKGDRATVFDHQRGIKLFDLDGPLPAVRILGFNLGIGPATGSESPTPCPYSAWEVEAFRPVLGLLKRAVTIQDPVLLGRIATTSTLINQRHRPKQHLPQILELARETGALGVQVAHSGTVAGLLFEPEARGARRVEQARAGLRRLGINAAWHFTTEAASHPEIQP